MRERRTIYHHNGYRLRSYTELMWARLLEASGIFYLYEPDLVRVDEGYYLPDFWLPNAGIYLEVKGKEPTPEEIQKADAVMARTGKEVMFLIGLPESDRGGLFNCGLLMRGANGWHHNISPINLQCLVRDHVSPEAAARMSLSVQKDDMDYVRPIGEIMEEMFLARADRSDMERVLRETHAEANAQRLTLMPEPTICETALKAFLDRQLFRTSQRGAA
ncbi:hypothetical protein AA042_21700 [Pseudomonas lundensis]|uniref:hypothetical protein n=1 Tax=Pseudomonas lundensis TaxID=86185 RepID=UPI00064193C7|nr:hypothetical protein [Pseudomonas lundensis]AOZ14967.1 hypothetical protein AA042_21700 [Pseudomonas lundensis]QVQ77747.1 hypothetical protein KIN24_01135 [Pseudomonas lundensis]QVQ83183.1 hypothetical protein KIY13_08305 [Pseudomonas lundensis]